MSFCICVSGIKYRVRAEEEFALREFAEYACPEAGICGRAGDPVCATSVAAASAEGCAEDCVELCVRAEDIEAERAGDLVQATDRNLFKAAVLRKVALESLKRGRMLVHGACIAYEGKGYLFTAPSGTGKTTHIGLWKKHLGDAVTIVNGDKPILRICGIGGGIGDGVTSADRGRCYMGREGNVPDQHIEAYGTPWAGKEGYQTNMSVPLCGIVEIVRGETNVIRRADKAQAFTWLFQHSYLGEKDAEQTRARMNAVKKLVTEVPCYVLECDMSEEAFACSFKALTGK